MKHAIKIMAAVAAFVFAFAAFADTEKVGDYTWTYTVTDFDGNTGAVIANGNDCAVSPKPTGALTIPSTLGGCPVRKLGDDSLKSCYSLTSVTIPSTVMTIGSDAFFYCNSLKSVTVPESVKSFGSSAFTYCERLAEFSVASGNPEYKSVNGHLLTKDGRRLVFGVVDANGESTIPSGVTIIGRDAFDGRRGLTSVTIPGSVTVILYCAFWDCENLTSVTIPDSVTDMGVKAFGACGKLTSASLPGRFRDDPFYRNSVFERCPDNLVITFRTPQFTVDGGVLTKVVANGNDNLTIPSTVTSIGNGAFKYLANVTNVTIPASVTLIDKRAFDGCSALKSFSVASGNPNYKSVSGLLLTKDGKTLVHGVNGAVTIPSGVATIGDSAFDRLAGLTSVTFPASVTNIDDYAFYYCTGLENVTLPDSIISVGDHVFAHCSGLKAASLPGRLNGKIKSYVFSNCASDFKATYRTPQFTINNGALTKVAPNGNDSVTVPSTVTSIGNGAFKNLENVTSVTIPASVTSIHKRAFDGCSALKSFSVASGNPNYKSVSGLLLTKDGKTLVHGVNGVVTIPSGVTTIGDSAFDHLAGLMSVTIPESVTNIDDYAFYYCTGLPGVIIPDSVTRIGLRVFSDCTGLTSMTIPDGVMHIDDRVFFNCASLTRVSLPQQFDGNLDEANVFANCSSSLKIHYRTPDFTIYNGKLASVSLNDATRVIIPGSVTEIAFAAFSGCGAMKYVTIPDSVTTIGFQAFYTCSSLMSVTIPDSVTSIDKYAFAYCSSLASVTLPARFKDNLDASVFDGCPAGMVITYRSDSSSIWTLKYHSNNGKNDLDTQSFNVGEAKRLYYMNSRLGWEYKDEDGFNYVFLGWAKSPTGAVFYENGELVQDLAAAGKVMHVYAVWQKRAYEVCFHSNDEDALVEYQEFRPNIAKNLYWLDSGLGWTRPGYDFLGWAKAPTSTAVVYANGETVENLVEQGQTLHLYAVWRDRRWTIRFHRNYSSGDSTYEDQKIPVGASVKLLWLDSQLKWTRDGYWFKGWAKSRTAGAAYVNGETVKDLVPGGQVLHLYGSWGKKTK